jgi:putative addiction module component (TIGR02574 family)
MTAIAEQIFEKAMTLGDEERITLAERLIGSVHDDPEIVAEHLEIAKRRAAEIESGTVDAIPGDEVFRMVREALAGQRRRA